MATYFSPASIPSQFNASGEPAASYVLHAFSSGASTTPQTMYTDNAGTSAGTSITLDAQGYTSTSGTRHSVWLDRSINYRLELRETDDTTVVWQEDNIAWRLTYSISDDGISTYTELRALDSSNYADGDIIYLSGDGIQGTFTIKTGSVSRIVGIKEPFADDANRYAEREYNGNPDITWSYTETGDVGASINGWTAAGLTTIYVPAGSYTQSTALTQDQEVYLYSDYWDVFGTPPATFVKDYDGVHIKTAGPFTSLGIKYDGNSVAGGATGVEVNGKIHFIGQVVSQTGIGLHVSEEIAGDNLNNSIIGGAFSGNSTSQLLIETEHTSDTNDLDINTIQFLYVRCNSGRIGLHVRGGLFNQYQYVNCKGNTEIGVFCEATNVISQNSFTIYSEQGAAAPNAVDFYAVDGWTAFGGAPTQTSSTTFTLTGDQTATFVAGGKIRCTDNGVEYTGTIDSAVFSSVTTVTVTMNGAVALTSNLTAVATDKANNNFRDNEFFNPRGLTAGDIYPKNGNVFIAASARRGIITNTQQPWVKVNLGGDVTNVTGNGTTYTVAFDTEIKDTQGNFNTSTYVFTAPTTGRYKFNGSLRLQGLSGGSHTRCEVNLVTSNRTYNLHDCNIDNIKSSSNIACLGFDVSADMDSNDTAYLTIEVTGAGVDDVDLSGGTGQTWMDIILEG